MYKHYVGICNNRNMDADFYLQLNKEKKNDYFSEYLFTRVQLYFIKNVNTNILFKIIKHVCIQRMSKWWYIRIQSTVSGIIQIPTLYTHVIRILLSYVVRPFSCRSRRPNHFSRKAAIYRSIPGSR
jgi:hypothetical protein